MSSPPVTEGPASVYTIDEDYESKGGYRIGDGNVFTIASIADVKKMKLEITYDGLLKGYVKYKDSFSSSDTGNTRNKYSFADSAPQSGKGIDTAKFYSVQAGTNVQVEFNRDDLSKSLSIYVELVDLENTGVVVPKNDTKQVAIYYDSSGNAFSKSNNALLVGMVILLVILILLLGALLVKLRKQQRQS